MKNGHLERLRDSPSASFEAQWRERFIEFASLHDDDAGIAGWSMSGLESRFRMFCRLWKPVFAGQLILDLGCGAGTYTRFLFDKGMRPVGVDYSLFALTKA